MFRLKNSASRVYPKVFRDFWSDIFVRETIDFYDDLFRFAYVGTPHVHTNGIVGNGNATNHARPTLDVLDSPGIKRRSRHAAKLNMGDTKDDIHVCIMCLRAIMNNKVRPVRVLYGTRFFVRGFDLDRIQYCYSLMFGYDKHKSCLS